MKNILSLSLLFLLVSSTHAYSQTSQVKPSVEEVESVPRTNLVSSQKNALIKEGFVENVIMARFGGGLGDFCVSGSR